MSLLLQPRWYCGSVCVGSIRLERKTSHTTHGGHVDVKTIILSLFVRTVSSSFGFQPLITPLSYCHNNDIPNEADSCKYSSALLHVYDICDRVIAMLLCHLSAPLQKKKVCHSVCGCCCIVVLVIITVIIIITIIITIIVVPLLFVRC